MTPLTSTQFDAYQAQPLKSSHRTQASREIRSSHKRFLCHSRSLKASEEFQLTGTAWCRLRRRRSRALLQRDEARIRLLNHAPADCAQLPSPFNSAFTLPCSQQREQCGASATACAAQPINWRPLCCDASATLSFTRFTNEAHHRLNLVEKSWWQQRAEGEAWRRTPVLCSAECQLHAERTDQDTLAESRLNTFELEAVWCDVVARGSYNDANGASATERHNHAITNNERVALWREVVVQSLALRAREVNGNANRCGRTDALISLGRFGPAHTVIRRSGCLARTARTIFSTCAAASSG
jgi:hypothetical protein